MDNEEFSKFATNYGSTSLPDALVHFQKQVTSSMNSYITYYCDKYLGKYALNELPIAFRDGLYFLKEISKYKLRNSVIINKKLF